MPVLRRLTPRPHRAVLVVAASSPVALVAVAACGCAASPPRITTADVDAAVREMARSVPAVSLGCIGRGEDAAERVPCGAWTIDLALDDRSVAARRPLIPDLAAAPPRVGDAEDGATVAWLDPTLRLDPSLDGEAPATTAAVLPWSDVELAGTETGRTSAAPACRDAHEWVFAATSPAASSDENIFSWDYVNLVGTDIERTFTAPARWDACDWTVAATVAAGVGVAFAFDDCIRSAVQRNYSSRLDDVLDAVEPFGAEYSFGVLGAFYLAGAIFDDARAKSVCMDGLAASLIASGLIVQPIKFTVGRARPNEDLGPYHFDPFSGDQSFPSGHATQAFAVATVIAEHYDSIWVKTVSWGLATMVGFARIENDAHWTSDVLAGAAIGFFVGELVVHVNEEHRHGVAVTPIFGPQTVGAAVSWSF